MRRPIGFTLLAVLATFQAFAAVSLGFLLPRASVLGPRAFVVAGLCLGFAVVAAAAALGLWRVRAWARWAVRGWAGGGLACVLSPYILVPPPSGQPLWVPLLGVGVVGGFLYLIIRYVDRRMATVPA